MQHYAGIYLLQNHSTCFGCPSHPSSGVHKTVTAASGTGHSIWATTFLQRGQWPHWRKVVAQTLWPVPEAAVSFMYSWWWVRWTPKTCSDFAVNKFLHNVASCWILLIYQHFNFYDIILLCFTEYSVTKSLTLKVNYWLQQCFPETLTAISKTTCCHSHEHYLKCDLVFTAWLHLTKALPR